MKYLCRSVISVVILLACAGLNAQNEPQAETVNQAPPKLTDDERCAAFVFASGCMGFSLGPMLSTDKNGLVYGAGAGFTYFLVDRLGASLSGGAIFGNGYQDYSVGPSLTYYIGPFGGYLLTPSISASRHFLRGDLNLEGWSYGPSIGLMTRLFGRIFWGISAGYYTFAASGYKTSSEWSFTPVVFVPF